MRMTTADTKGMWKTCCSVVTVFIDVRPIFTWFTGGFVLVAGPRPEIKIIVQQHIVANIFVSLKPYMVDKVEQFYSIFSNQYVVEKNIIHKY